MSGRPSWAFTEPSQNCTAEWMMLCGWMSTCIFFGGWLKSHFASMTSNPLFMRVAESMVIFAPMSQVGCLSASPAVTVCSCSSDSLRKGPPEQVSSIFSMESSDSPTMDWKMAECSLSMGRMGTLFSPASWQMSCPATTSVSLLASSIFLWALMAWMVGESPAKPTIAAMTLSMGSACTISSMACLPA